MIGVKMRLTQHLKMLEAQQKVIDQIALRLQKSAAILATGMRNHLAPSPNYSLKELRKMGYPYAKKKWWSPTTPDPLYATLTGLKEDYAPKGGTPASGIHEPFWEVNIQTAQLIKDLKVSSTEVYPFALEVRVGVPQNAASNHYARHVIYGTRTMAPRNFITKTAIENLGVLRTLVCQPLGKRM